MHTEEQLKPSLQENCECTQTDDTRHACEEYFRQLTENIQEVFWLVDVSSQSMLYISPAYEVIWGRSCASLYASRTPWPDAVHPDDLLRVQQVITTSQSTGTYDEEFRIVRPDKSIRWIRQRAFPVRNSEGVVYRIAGVAKDITEQKQSDEALRESEQRFKALFEQAAVGVSLVEVETEQFVQVNQRFSDIVGRSRQTLQHLTFSAITLPQDVSSCQEMISKLQGGAIREFTQQKRFMREDGSETWANVTMSALWAPGETPNFFIVVAQDISEQKRMEEQFRQAQKLEAIGTLAGGIAHDFNNILAAIVGYSELSLMILKENPEVREYLGATLQASSRATGLIRQILAFSRQQRLERRPIELRPVVVESIKLLRATIPSTVEFVTSLAADAPTVLADATQIHQVLMNLGTNAWQAMKDSTGRLDVKLERCVVDAAHASLQPRLRAGLYARITVTDTGCGMDPATLQRIFDPFFTTKPPGAGTGLGLAVVHGIMETHDGAVTVYSHPGEGTVFQLYFPANDGEAIEAAVKEGTAPRGHGERILFVDDEELLAKLGQKTLTALGYEVEVATRAVAALAMVCTDPQRFSLVITDQTMPGMTGVVLANELRQVRSGLPVILTTGHSLSVTAEQLKAAGIRQQLFKPTTIQSLGTAVHEALQPKLPTKQAKNPPLG